MAGFGSGERDEGVACWLDGSDGAEAARESVSYPVCCCVSDGTVDAAFESFGFNGQFFAFIRE